MASETDWTEEMVARLRAFWNEGHSTAEIGRRMGLSKNAVVGKAHRLNLPPRPSPIRAKGSGSRPRNCGPTRTRGPSLPTLRPVADGTAPPRLPAKAPTPAPAKSAIPVFVRRTSRDPCCWPIGEPGTRSYRTCDAPAKPGKPYCAEHAEAAYVPVRSARDRPDGRSLDRYLKRELTRTA